MTNKLSESAIVKEQTELGKKLQAFYDIGYVNKKTALGFSFLKGMAGGAGAFLGGTLVIALLWILSFFNSFPFVSHLVKTLQVK